MPEQAAGWQRVSRRLCPACLVAALMIVGPVPAHGQQLELAFDGGHVTLRAHGVTVRQVLEEWARRGRTRVVNAERVSDRRVSLDLVAVPEAQALARILESAVGYVARLRAGTEGPSDFGLIMILSTSEAAAPSTSMADADAARWDLQPVADHAAVPDVESSSTEAADKDAGSLARANDANGRASDARPEGGPAGGRDASAVVPAEKLPSGRPDGARPGRPSALAAPPAAVPPADGTPQTGGSPAVDANGRPLKKP